MQFSVGWSHLFLPIKWAVTRQGQWTRAITLTLRITSSIISKGIPRDYRPQKTERQECNGKPLFGWPHKPPGVVLSWNIWRSGQRSFSHSDFPPLSRRRFGENRIQIVEGHNPFFRPSSFRRREGPGGPSLIRSLQPLFSEMFS